MAPLCCRAFDVMLLTPGQEVGKVAVVSAMVVGTLL